MKHFYPQHLRGRIRLLALTLVLTLCNTAALGQKEMQVEVRTPGTLHQLIPEADIYRITGLTVKGEINGTDLHLLRAMAGAGDYTEETPGILENLDLREARFVKGGDPHCITQSYNGDIHTYTTINDTLPPLAFFRCKSLKRVILPETMPIINQYGFSFCNNLQEIIFPKSLKKIFDYTFSFCSSLANIDLPQDLEYIGNYVFSDCTSLKKIVLPPNTIEIGEYTFYNCKNLEDAILNNLKTIGYCAFSYTGLTEIQIPASLKNYDKTCFEGSYIRRLKIDPENPWYTAIDNVIYSKDKTRLIQFLQHDAETFTVPSHVRVIESHAFGNVFHWIKSEENPERTQDSKQKLEKVILNRELERVEADAFSLYPYNQSLKELICLASTPPACGSTVDGKFEEDIFLGSYYFNYSIQITVPMSSAEKYREALGWRNFSRIVESDLTGVDHTTAEADWNVTVTKGGIHITNAPKGSAVSVYDVQGHLIHRCTANGSGLNLTLPEKQVYVVKVGNASRKVAP